MRLFIAVNFSEDVKKALAGIQARLREHTERGNFTSYENLHLTLVFLGEVEPGKVGLVGKIMNASAVPAFNMRICGAGSFKRGGSEIVWAGVEAEKELEQMQRQLSEHLAESGFAVEKRGFTPHLTLARDVIFKDDFKVSDLSDGMDPIETRITKISLMKSERVKGRLTYTEIRGTALL